MFEKEVIENGHRLIPIFKYFIDVLFVLISLLFHKFNSVLFLTCKYTYIHVGNSCFGGIKIVYCGIYKLL